MYINGVAVGKDNVPFTQFNSNIVRFKVNKPFTIAMLLVDWKENLGLGSENNNGFTYHPEDGGMVAVFKDASNNTIATTSSNWKAQTFYTSPITDLSCPTESGTNRLTTNCSTADSNNGSAYYGLHWNRPANWTTDSFNDSSWPSASIYSNATIGVSNKPAYTNFTNIFDDATNDAQFIRSSNVILDNEIIVRCTVNATTSIKETSNINKLIRLYPNPANNELKLDIDKTIKLSDIKNISIFNSNGQKIYETKTYDGNININTFLKGLYVIKILLDDYQITEELIIS